MKYRFLKTRFIVLHKSNSFLMYKKLYLRDCGSFAVSKWGLGCGSLSWFLNYCFWLVWKLSCAELCTYSIQELSWKGRQSRFDLEKKNFAFKIDDHSMKTIVFLIFIWGRPGFILSGFFFSPGSTSSQISPLFSPCFWHFIFCLG